MFSEVAEIALVAERLGQFQQLLKTRVILNLNFTRDSPILISRSKKAMRANYEPIEEKHTFRHIFTVLINKFGFLIISLLGNNHFLFSPCDNRLGIYNNFLADKKR